MGYEGNEFAVYINAYYIDGGVGCGVYDTENEACDAARALVAELEGLTDEDDGTLDALTAAELENRIMEQDIVGFAQVAQRTILFR